ncbi:cytochrome P450 [Enhygromyxa salina]|nr:cytochrome P450 [Enhygromyxa salina]
MTDFNALFSPENYDNPYPLYAEMREHSPVLHFPQHDMFIVSRFEDVQRVMRDAKLFSSATIDENTVQDPRLLAGAELVIGSNSMITSDPPDHSRLRKLARVAFTPRAIARLEGRIRELAREMIAAIARKDSFDLMAELAVPLPVKVIAEMLGVDPERHADFKRWSDDLVAGDSRNPSLDEAELERIISGCREFTAFLHEMIEQRQREYRDDLIGDLVRAQSEQDKLSAEEVMSMVSLLLIAGNETTTNLIGNATIEILRNPAELQRLRADPRMIPAFIEEALRFRAPANMIIRTVTEDVTIADVAVPANSKLGGLLDSANHDPSHFPEPERFDLDRNPAHLSFGYGIHFCIGAALSRLEGRVVFEELFAGLPPFSREPGPPDWQPNFLLRGLRRLPLRFESRAA